MLPTFHVFGLELPAYTTMMVLAFFAALAVAVMRHKIYGMSALDVFIGMFFAGAGGLIGAGTLSILQNLPAFFAIHQVTGIGFIEFMLNYAGLVYYGGFFGVMLSLLLFCRLFKIRLWHAIDTMLPTLPLAHAIGRMGCFFGGCCYGIPHEHGIRLPASPYPDTPLLPVQLIEAACLFGLFALMMVYGRAPRTPGRIVSIYLTSYGTIRFVLEFFRYDEIRGIYGAFSLSQWISLGLITAGLALALFYKPGRKIAV